MDQKLKIMIMTAPYGNGHVSVAKGIDEEVKKHNNLECVVYDMFSEEYPKTSKLLKKFHLRQYKKGIEQQTYKYVYYNSDKLLKTRVAKVYNNFGLKRLIKKVEKEQPDILINTFPINCTYYLKDRGYNIPIYTMITDYYANANWISKTMKRHFISSENVVGQLKKRDIEDEQYQITGIPVKEQFYKEYTQEQINELKDNLHINRHNKVVLLVAGASGVLPKFKKIVSEFIKQENLSLVIVCGKNQKLYKQLHDRFGKRDNVKIFEFVTNIYELMWISDIMVTKPGGITITEASHIGLPLVLFKPIYGQELENAIYFTARNAATIALNDEEVTNQVLDILNNEEKLASMKRNIKKIATKDSARLIVDSIINDFKSGDNNANNEN